MYPKPDAERVGQLRKTIARAGSNAKARQGGGGGGLEMTVLTNAPYPRPFCRDWAGHRASDLQDPSRGEGLVPCTLPGLASSRDWRPQEGHTEGNAGYG